MEPEPLVMVGRIFLAAGLGLLIGLERERHGRAAGLRTCMLVAAAGALLMSLSLHLSQIFAEFAIAGGIRLDPGRLPSYAVAGMGFLGAGAIIQGRSTAVGITTAAALWTCTGVGLAVGVGLYLPALATVGLALFALTVLRSLAGHIGHEQYVTLTVEMVRPGAEAELRALLGEFGVRINFAGRDRCLKDDTTQFRFSLAVRAGTQWGELLARLEALPGLTCYGWHQSEVP